MGLKEAASIFPSLVVSVFKEESPAPCCDVKTTWSVLQSRHMQRLHGALCPISVLFSEDKHPVGEFPSKSWPKSNILLT